MKPVFILLIGIACTFSCATKTGDSSSQKETEMADTTYPNLEEGDWISLFDGETTNGWHVYKQEGMHESWSVEDGALKFTPPAQDERPDYYLNIVSDEEYGDFILSIEWKVQKAGNSGIFWAVKETDKYPEPYMTGPEIQVLDNAHHPDAKNGENRQAGALYDLVAPAKDVSKPHGEWNHCVIKIDHKANTGTAWLNGEVTAQFPAHGPEWEKMIANSKFTEWEDFGTFREGRISLQDHNDVVWFRNIKLKKL